MRPRWYCSFSFSTFIIFFLFAWHTYNVLLMCATIALTILCPLKIRTLSSTLTLHFPAQGDWASKSSKRSNASVPKDESERDCHRLREATGPDTGYEPHVCALGINTARARHDHRLTASRTALPRHPDKHSPASSCGRDAYHVWSAIIAGGGGRGALKQHGGGVVGVVSILMEISFLCPIVSKRGHHPSPSIVPKSGRHA